MKKLLIALLATVFYVGIVNADDILTEPNKGLSNTNFEKIVKNSGGKIVGKVGDTYIVDSGQGVNKELVLQNLKNSNHIKFAELNDHIMPDYIPNDPNFYGQWHLDKIRAPDAWDISPQGDGIIVALCDTGVNPVPDIVSNLLSGWNTIYSNNDTSDLHGHGTLTAGTVAATTNNGIGVSSVSPMSKILPIKVTIANDGNAGINEFASCIKWADGHGASVISISYGVSGYGAVQSAAQSFKNKGGLVVSSAGNSGGLNTLLDTTSIINVSATDSNDSKAGFSTYGPFVDVSAPGVGILTTNLSGGYSSVNGTSFSSPIVAGTIALMMSAAPTLKAAEIEAILKTTAKDLGSPGYDEVFGFGRVDAYEAVLAAKTYINIDSTPPTVTITYPVNGQTVSGLLPVNITATDNLDISKVILLVNGVDYFEDSLQPYNFSLDTTTLCDCTITLTVVAVDISGNRTTKSITVSVRNIPDTIPPTLTIVSPIDGKVVARTETIQTNVYDNVSSASAILQQLYIDNILVKSINGGTLSYKWSTSKINPGVHIIKVVATDEQNNSTTQQVSVIK